MPELTHSTMFKYVPPICVCYYGALRKRAERMRSAYYARGRRLLLTHHLLLQAVNLCLLVFFSCLLSASFSSLLPLGIYMLAATYSRSQVTAAQLLVPKVHLSYHGLRRFLWRPHINKSPWDFRQHPPPFLPFRGAAEVCVWVFFCMAWCRVQEPARRGSPDNGTLVQLGYRRLHRHVKSCRLNRHVNYSNCTTIGYPHRDAGQSCHARPWQGQSRMATRRRILTRSGYGRERVGCGNSVES